MSKMFKVTFKIEEVSVSEFWEAEDGEDAYNEACIIAEKRGWVLDNVSQWLQKTTISKEEYDG